MKTILVLIGEKLSANGICADAVMQEMQNRGYKVICVTFSTIKRKIGR